MYDYVLLGKVAKIDYRFVETYRAKVPRNTVTFETLEGFKGIRVGQDLAVLDFSLICGPELVDGATYLVFAKHEDEQELPILTGCSHFLYDLPKNYFPSSDIPDRERLDLVLEMIRKSI